MYFVMLTHFVSVYVNTGSKENPIFIKGSERRFNDPSLRKTYKLQEKECQTKVIEKLRVFRDLVFSEIAIIE